MLPPSLEIPTVGLGQEPAGWRQGVLADLSTALGAAAKQGGLVLVCFSSDPVADDSVAAQVFGAPEVREWANTRKLTLAIIEFARAKDPAVAEARSRFVELTREYKIADSPTWLFLDAKGKEIGRLDQDDVLPADSRGDLAQTFNPEIWLKQAAATLKGARPAALPEPVKEPTWYARFGGQGWTGKRTVTGEEGAMNYTLFVPSILAKGQKYPLVIWLHGGGRSDGNQFAAADAVHLSVAASRSGKPSLVLIPSAIAGQNWMSSPAIMVTRPDQMPTEPTPSMRLIAKLIDDLIKNHPIDPGKVVVLGESGGAYGSWALLQQYPDRFAGAVVNGGGGNPAKVAGLAKKRIWVVHGEQDKIVNIQYGQAMFEALLKLRGEESRVVTEGDWVKAANADDTVRFWKHTKAGHVPPFDYGAALDWVLQTR
jgi:poly(3-hydroxybutyrate) depolymerase